MLEATLKPQFRDALLAIGLIAVILLFTIIFLFLVAMKGTIGRWFAPVIIVNALLNAGIVLYFNVLRRTQAQPK